MTQIPDILSFSQRLLTAGRAAGFRAEPFGEIEGCPLFALTKRSPGVHPRIYLSAGIHGDEPAPPLALLEMIEAGRFDGRATWFLCPLLNPAGLSRATRENAGGVDLNRDYRHSHAPETRAHIGWLRRQPNFDLTICVHEDWEARGFYLYEANPSGPPRLAEAMLAAVRPICPIDHREQIDTWIAIDGIIRPTMDPMEREKWPEAFYLRVNHNSALHYTIETPSGFPVAQRVAALRAAMEVAIEATAGAPRKSP